jgi:hypothetical protein
MGEINSPRPLRGRLYQYVNPSPGTDRDQGHGSVSNTDTLDMASAYVLAQPPQPALAIKHLTYVHLHLPVLSQKDGQSWRADK